MQRMGWGNVSASDRAQNNGALRAGERLFSAYHVVNGSKVRVITEVTPRLTTITARYRRFPQG